MATISTDFDGLIIAVTKYLPKGERRPQDNTITTTAKGSTSRPARSAGPLPFDKVTLDNKAQKSHIIPQSSTKTYQELFNEIADAKLPSGDRPFDPTDYLDNGQALPSRNTDAAGKAIFELSQHNGSHPVINELVEDQLRVIDDELSAVLRSPGVTEEARNAARVVADTKVKNVAEAFAAISVGGVVDPANPTARAIYNLSDANAQSVIEGFDSLDAAGKRAAIKNYDRDLVRKLLNSSGELTTDGSRILKVLRDFTGGSVGAISPADVKLAQAVLADMTLHKFDPAKLDGAKYVESHLAKLAPAGTELAKSAERITAARLARVAGKFVLTTAAHALAIFDYVDVAGTAAAVLKGDAHFSPGIDDASFDGGTNYLFDWATKASQQGVLGSIPLSEDFAASIANLTGETRRQAIESWVNSRYELPTGLAFHITAPTATDAYGIYYVDDTSTPGVIEDIKVLWSNPVGGGSNSSRAAAMVLERAPDGTTLIVTDLETGKTRAYFDPHRAKEQAFVDAVTSTDAEIRRQKQEELAAGDARSVEVERLPNGRPDPSSVEHATEVIGEHVVNGELVALPPEIVITGKNPEYRIVSVVVDGVVHVVRGLVNDIEQLLTAIAKGPGVLLEDIRKFGSSKQGLIDFADVGQILGSQLSNALAIEDPWARIGAATAIGSILSNIGQSLDLIGSTVEGGGKLGMTQAIDKAFNEFGKDVLQAGTGAVSSYLVGNLFAEIGLKGDTLDAAVAFAGPTIGKIAYNALTRANWNAGLTTGFYATAAASFLGSKLADRIITFDSMTGQIGAAVGEAVGTIIAAKLFEGSLATGNPYAIVAAAVVVAVSKILGG
jgi:hypothetical protein